jgi:hypothetical protein
MKPRPMKDSSGGVSRDVRARSATGVLKDAAAYITGVAEERSGQPRMASRDLSWSGELDGPTMFARRHAGTEPRGHVPGGDSTRKDHHWGPWN